MKKNLKWAVAAMAAVVLIACQKETPQSTANKPGKQPAAMHLDDLMSTKIASITHPHCTMAHGQSCQPEGFGCMLRFPPNPNTGAPEVAARFYAPVTTGQGVTGQQMVVEFLSPAQGIEEGLLGPEEGPQSTITVYAEMANQLGFASIRVINRRYTAAFDEEHPHGYVIYDCIARR